MKIKLDEVEFDSEIYPRQQISQKTVESYVEALKGGAVFPPVEVQKVRYKNGEEKMICLDGKHRIMAIEEYNNTIKQEKKENEEEKRQPIFEIEANGWRDETLQYEKNVEELRIRSAVLNRRHGDRLSSKDLAMVVLKILKERPIERLNGVISELARKFGYTQPYISSLETAEGKVSVVLAKRRLARDFEIWRLLQLGWAYKEAGEAFGLKERVTYDICSNISTYITAVQQQYSKNHKSAEEIAQFHNLDMVTTWVMILHGKTDLERFKLFGKEEYQDAEPRLYNVWNFTQCDPRLGDEHPGRIPGQIILNLLYYYTKQGDLVVDPMAGGGSTIDACLTMNRKCKAYDIAPVRKEIIKHDLNDGFPKEVKGCDLIFLDPPYWNLKKGFYDKGSISEVDLGTWLAFMKKVIRDSLDVLHKDGHIALIIEAVDDERASKNFYDLLFLCMKYFEEFEFKEVYRISIPLTTQVKSMRDVDFAKRNKIILNVNRDLVIYKQK